MPIVFIHGVAVRNSERKPNASWPDLSRSSTVCRTVMSGRPTGHDLAGLVGCAWGAVAWGGASRPLSVMLGKGGIRPAPDWLEQAVGLAEMPGLIRRVPGSLQPLRSEGTLVAEGRESAWSGRSPVG